MSCEPGFFGQGKECELYMKEVCMCVRIFRVLPIVSMATNYNGPICPSDLHAAAQVSLSTRYGTGTFFVPPTETSMRARFTGRWPIRHNKRPL